MKTLFASMLGVLFFTASYSQVTDQRTSVVPGMTCMTCHTSEVPTKETPSVRNCPRTLMATVRHSAEEGPNIIRMNLLSDSASVFVPVSFTHKAHAEMSEMAGGCTVCHHYNPPGRVLGCNECHEKSRIRTNLGRPDLKGAYHQQCLNCHRRWSDDTGCQSCHARRSDGAVSIAGKKTEHSESRIHPVVTKPNKVVRKTGYEEGQLVTFYHNEHVDLFGLECSACHTSEGCIRCHRKEKKVFKRPAETSVGHSACESCHNVSEACNRCHGAEPKTGFNHQRRSGWALKHYHERLECTRCHTRKKFSGLSSTCIACHKAWTPENFRHGVVGLVLDKSHTEFTCDVCHTDGRFVTQPSCNGCHEHYAYPQKSPGKRVKRIAVSKAGSNAH